MPTIARNASDASDVIDAIDAMKTHSRRRSPRAPMLRSLLLSLALAALAFACAGSPDPDLSPDFAAAPAGTLGINAPRYIATIATDRYDHPDFHPLVRAEADANAIERAFRSRLRFEARDDLRLRGDEATTDNILHLIGPEGPLKALPRDAMVVLYLALHGGSLDCAPPTVEGEKPKPRRCGQLVTRDARRSSQTIALSTLLDQIAQHGPHHTIVLIDACYGGLTLGVPVKELDYESVLHPIVRTAPDDQPRHARRPGDRRSRKVLTSAGPTQKADDGDAANPKRPSHFAEALLQGLDGAADLYADGWLLFPELAIYLHAEVRRLSDGAQEPEYDGFNDDGRGAPVLGALRLAEGEAGDPDALLGAARAQVERGEVHGAIWLLRQTLAARAERALAQRQRLSEANTLAATGQGSAAVAHLEPSAKRSTRGAADPAAAVMRQVQVRIARETGLSADELTRLETRATEAALDVAATSRTAAGQARLMSGLGGLAAVAGAPRVAGQLASQARAAAEAADEPALIAALAGNEAAAFTAAGDTARAAAARVVEAAAVDRAARREPAAPTAASPPEPTAAPGIERAPASFERLPATAARPMMLPIPAGSFVMGSPKGEAGRDGDETQRPVTLTRAFWMAETEVTQAQYAAAMGHNPSHFTGEPGDGIRPVEQVSWLDAVRYCNALSVREGLAPVYAIDGTDATDATAVTLDPDADGYRLPTEAEWEYAARAGTATATYAGDLRIIGDNNAPVLDAIAWYGGNSGSTHPKAWDSSRWADKQHPHERASTQPVKGKQPNAWGLYDMLGNVWEWTGDWYAAEPAGPAADPAGPPSGGNRVFRGGSWDGVARYVRSAVRSRYHPGYRNRVLGFRPVRLAPRGS